MSISSGNVVQTNVTGNIDEIVINAKSDYFFPADYTVAEQNGITVKRDDENQLTISGTPTADVNMTLTQATEKVYNMTLGGNGTFTGTCCQRQ